MAKIALANPTFIVNNASIRIVPNSGMYTEGFGEQNVRTQSGGGGDVETIISDNAETKKSNVKFSLFPTSENIALARQFKANVSNNAIQIISDGFERTIGNAIVINDYEVNLGADTQIDLEFEGSASV